MELNARVIEACEFYGSGVDSSYFAPASAQWSFVIQIQFSVVADSFGWNGQGFGACGFFEELPGEQDVAVFEHEVPMLAVGRGVV